MAAGRAGGIFRTAVLITALFGTLMRIIISFYVGFGLPVFLYFTVQSNIMVCVFLILELFIHRSQKSYPAVHGGIVLYILITGIIYNTLLAGGVEADGLNLAVVTINHTVTPVGFFIDWLINSRHGRTQWRHYRLWMIYPLAYLAASSVEGLITGDFRYPFLNFLSRPPHLYAAGLIIVIAAFFITGAFLIFLDRKLSKKQYFH